ncbi:HigA family addiction module antitoxin [Mucilaginibacter sp. KACC 22773]|uniref:HigA family addiction module antitoxin n=1 Tax=Mucilaginibacter sp. KACC 22773 TaxID=3025671 RepID=UPI00236712C2|nr:HigA family addiction module antitoxin [Mucilaginibacter sp. KACC 22773]WDF79539.1 HigA family addiction module antitoxin [Mucilaginibacter sp. KACC 22773]
MGNVFDKEGNQLRTPIAFHPGELLLEEIEERGLKKIDFAKAIGQKPGNLSDLFKGKRHISAQMAIKIEKALDISAEYWLGLQSAYDLTIARRLEHAC